MTLDTTTLDTLRPEGCRRPIHITAEYKGSRYLITHATGWIEAENIACDYARAFDDVAFFTGDVYGSQSINGNARDFRRAYNGKAEGATNA
jgi:hypothetical protein